MFLKIFSFIFTARAIKPVLTFEYFGFEFSKLKLNYKFLLSLLIIMPATIFQCACLFLKNNLFHVDRSVSSQKY